MKRYEVGECQLRMDSSHLILEGELAHLAQLEELERTMDEISSLWPQESVAQINVVNCRRCSSILLKVFLNALRDSTAHLNRLVLQVATEDGERIPWHHTFVDYLSYFNQQQCEIEVEEVPI